MFVEAGDFVGFHYVANEPQARPRSLGPNQIPEGVDIEIIYAKTVFDNELPIGTTIVVEERRPRALSLAVFVA